MQELQGRAERLPDRPVGLQPAGHPQRRQGQGQGTRQQVKIVGFDENAETLQGIADGHIFGTVVQSPYQFGYQSVKLMAAWPAATSRRCPADGIVPIDFRIITKDGGKEYRPVRRRRAFTARNSAINSMQLLGKEVVRQASVSEMRSA